MKNKKCHVACNMCISMNMVFMHEYGIHARIQCTCMYINTYGMHECTSIQCMYMDTMYVHGIHACIHASPSSSG